MSIGYGSVATMEIFDDKNENINAIWLRLQATIKILNDKRKVQESKYKCHLATATGYN